MSPDADFGGLSALVVSPDGARFVAVSDQSHWVTGSLVYSRGNLVCAKGIQIAPMLAPDGHSLRDKEGDAEGLASVGDGGVFDELMVSFEGKHRVWRYPFGRDGARAVPVDFPLPPEALQAPPNAGLEGITRIDEDTLLAVTEHFRNRQQNYRAWLLPLGHSPFGPPEPEAKADVPHDWKLTEPREIAIRADPPFAMTDVRQMPGGDLITLERRYDPANGVGAQLRRIPVSAMIDAIEKGPAAPLDGEVLATLDTDFEIDNMEGLSIGTGPNGETLLWMVSDDNFNRPVQRTLLLMFEMMK
jgi:hypothetical protein